MRPSDESAVPRRSILEKLLIKKWEYSFPAFSSLVCALPLASPSSLSASCCSRTPVLGLLPLAFAALAFVFGPYIYNKVTRSRPWQFHSGLSAVELRPGLHERVHLSRLQLRSPWYPPAAAQGGYD